MFIPLMTVLAMAAQKQKFRSNIEAIEALNKIEAEHRFATADEQKILCKYVGWGGLAEAFDPSNEA